MSPLKFWKFVKQFSACYFHQHIKTQKQQYIVHLCCPLVYLIILILCEHLSRSLIWFSRVTFLVCNDLIILLASIRMSKCLKLFTVFCSVFVDTLCSGLMDSWIVSFYFLRQVLFCFFVVAFCNCGQFISNDGGRSCFIWKVGQEPLFPALYSPMVKPEV